MAASRLPVLTGEQSRREAPRLQAVALGPEGFSLNLLFCPRGGLRRGGPCLRTCFRTRDRESSEAAAPARCSRRPSSGFSPVFFIWVL